VFFQSRAPHITLGWGAWGIGAAARDGGSRWGEMHGHGSARGWSEWKNSNGRSSGTIPVVAGALGCVLAQAGSPAPTALGCCRRLPGVLLVSLDQTQRWGGAWYGGAFIPSVLFGTPFV